MSAFEVHSFLSATFRTCRVVSMAYKTGSRGSIFIYLSHAMPEFYTFVPIKAMIVFLYARLMASAFTIIRVACNWEKSCTRQPKYRSKHHFGIFARSHDNVHESC